MGVSYMGYSTLRCVRLTGGNDRKKYGALAMNDFPKYPNIFVFN